MSSAAEMQKMAPIRIDTYHLSLNVWTNRLDSSNPEM